jgi:hypothetical protein
VASYRDKYNPETIHFPAELTSKFLILVGWGLCLLCAVGCMLTHQPLVRTLLELVFLAAVSVFLMRCWPADLRIELRGLSSHWLWKRRTFIPWGDVDSAQPQTKRLGPLGRVEYYVVRGRNGLQIAHTDRHADRERFVFELKRHGVAVAADAYED